jgi:hypothetical protein
MPTRIDVGAGRGDIASAFEVKLAGRGPKANRRRAVVIAETDASTEAGLALGSDEVQSKERHELTTVLSVSVPMSDERTLLRPRPRRVVGRHARRTHRAWGMRGGQA